MLYIFSLSRGFNSPAEGRVKRSAVQGPPGDHKSLLGGADAARGGGEPNIFPV
jgi:hypothetical protein